MFTLIKKFRTEITAYSIALFVILLGISVRLSLPEKPITMIAAGKSMMNECPVYWVLNQQSVHNCSRYFSLTLPLPQCKDYKGSIAIPSASERYHWYHFPERGRRKLPPPPSDYYEEVTGEWAGKNLHVDLCFYKEELEDYKQRNLSVQFTACKKTSDVELF